MIDAVACEPQFVDHAAPVWLALPADVRGTFYVDEPLVGRALGYGIEPVAIDSYGLRRAIPTPKASREPGPLAFVVSIGDTKVARRMGYRRFVSMEHGAGQSYRGTSLVSSYAGGPDRDDTVLFLQPNEYSANLYRAAYPAARVEVVGSPRLDDLPRRYGPGTTVAISFHWPAPFVPESRSALGVYQRFLPALAAAFDTIGHAHPKGDWPDRMQRAYRRAGIPFVGDFRDVCRRADVYVTDNSSTLYEFASTGRPVVVLNAPSYRKHVNHGLRFWEAATVGVQVERGEDLVDGVREALEDAPERQAAREAALDIVYAYRTGAAARAAEAIASIALRVAA